MKTKTYVISILLFLSVFFMIVSCRQKQDKVEKIMEDGVEVVLNPLESYKVEGKPASLSLQEEFVIDPEKDEIAEIGLGEFAGIDVDSEENIYFWTRRSSTKFICKFDRYGNFITSFGRSGQGPGEFQFITYFDINEKDEILAIDAFRRKLCILSIDGLPIKEVAQIQNNYFIMPLSSGSFLISTYKYNPEEEYHHNVISLCDSEFNEIKELYRHDMPNYDVVNNFVGIPYRLLVDSSLSNIFIGAADKGYEISVFNLQGDLKRKIRKEYNPVPVLDSYKEKFLERFDSTPEIKKKVTFPKTMPPCQYGFTDETGRLFVMTYEKGEKAREYIYDIFNPNGVFIGRTNLENYGLKGRNESPLFAMAKKDRIYCTREKDSGFKELVVYKMIWN